MPLRTFFAIDLPLESKIGVTDCVELLKRQFRHNRIRWAKPENIHITLQFVGTTNVDDIMPLLEKVRYELEEQRAFHLSLGPLELFPSPQNPRVLSLKVGPQQTLAKLALAIARGVKAADYPIEDRLFRGHLTLAHVEGVELLDEKRLDEIHLPVFPPMLIRELVFYESEPQAGGSKYTRLASIELRRG